MIIPIQGDIQCLPLREDSVDQVYCRGLQAAQSPYNPFLDYNHDDKINLQDLVTLANSYGTKGDPTENVNVTNWPTNLSNESSYLIQTLTLNCTFLGFDSDELTYSGSAETPTIYVGGFSRMWIYLIPPNVTDTTQYAVNNYNATHEVSSIYWADGCIIFLLS